MIVSLITWILINNYRDVITSIVLVLIVTLVMIVLSLNSSIIITDTTAFNNMFNFDSIYYSIMLVSVLLLLYLISTYNNTVLQKSVRQEQIILLLLLLVAISSLSSSITIIALFASVEVQSLVLYLVLSTKVSDSYSLTFNHSVKPSIIYLFNASCATALLLYSISIISPMLLLVSLLWKLGTIPVHAWMIPVVDMSHSIISSVILSLSKYGLLVMISLISSNTTGASSLLYYLSLINLVLGTLIALIEIRYIRILAWTSMIQIGYVLLVIHSNYHSISLLFFELYTCYTVLLIILFNNNRVTSISNISNLISTPQLFLMIAMLYSIAGIPYASLFWVKLDILLHVPVESFTIALFITFLSSLVYVRLIKQISFSRYSTW